MEACNLFNLAKRNSSRTSRRQSDAHHRRGVAIIYMSIMLVTLSALCSLAVDFGRWEMCKTQLQRAADAAARSAAFQLANGASLAVNYATIVSWLNTVDAQNVLSNSNVTVNIQVLNWTSATNYTILSSGNYSTANAVRVTLTYNVPLTFGSLVGISSKTASRSSTAVLNVSSQNIYVSGNGEVWLAGEPTGTQASQPDPGYSGQGVNPLHPWQYDYAGPYGTSMADGEPYSSPAQATIPITPGAIITVSNVTGSANYDPGYFDAGNAKGLIDGATAPIVDNVAAGGIEEHGIADVYMPADSLNAVFLNSSVPDGTSAPAPLDFSTASARSYSSISPQLKQPFFVGQGQTSTGTQQSIIVPQGAARMFFGIMDCWEWSNNSGGYTVTITQKSVQTVQ
jgi:Flp pilus assembly protein TadG